MISEKLMTEARESLDYSNNGYVFNVPMGSPLQDAFFALCELGEAVSVKKLGIFGDPTVYFYTPRSYAIHFGG